jgi:(p)ppGpp synthase/HD superfamily hydrolase
MNIIEKSLAIALSAYSGMQDKAGRSYILHALRVMGKMEEEDEMAAALLHDVVKSSKYTAKDLLNAGIPSHVVGAVECLTRVDGETYESFIERVQTNPLATAVKIADLEDNLDILRLDTLGESELRRVAQFHRARKKLTRS